MEYSEKRSALWFVTNCIWVYHPRRKDRRSAEFIQVELKQTGDRQLGNLSVHILDYNSYCWSNHAISTPSDVVAACCCLCTDCCRRRPTTTFLTLKVNDDEIIFGVFYCVIWFITGFVLGKVCEREARGISLNSIRAAGNRTKKRTKNESVQFYARVFPNS